jgi:hypothetical protein
VLLLCAESILSTKLQTPLDAFISQVQNLSVPTNLTQVLPLPRFAAAYCIVLHAQ